MARRSSKRQAGVSLIEVLVAMLVVSLGVLAMSGMLGAAARFGKTSEFRSVATLLASDMADRMRANKAAVLYKGVAYYDLLNPYDPPESPPPDAPPCGDPKACTPSELAAQDLAQWAQSLYYNLPSGQGYIAPDPSVNPPVAADIWVAWLDPVASEDEATAGSNQTRQECPPGFRDLDPQPRCLYFRVAL